MKVLKRLLTTLLITATFTYMLYILGTQQAKLNELNNEISKINIVGERYPEDQEKLTGI